MQPKWQHNRVHMVIVMEDEVWDQRRIGNIAVCHRQNSRTGTVTQILKMTSTVQSGQCKMETTLNAKHYTLYESAQDLCHNNRPTSEPGNMPCSFSRSLEEELQLAFMKALTHAAVAVRNTAHTSQAAKPNPIHLRTWEWPADDDFSSSLSCLIRSNTADKKETTSFGIINGS